MDQKLNIPGKVVGFFQSARIRFQIFYKFFNICSDFILMVQITLCNLKSRVWRTKFNWILLKCGTYLEETIKSASCPYKNFDPKMKHFWPQNFWIQKFWPPKWNIFDPKFFAIFYWPNLAKKDNFFDKNGKNFDFGDFWQICPNLSELAWIRPNFGKKFHKGG